MNTQQEILTWSFKGRVHFPDPLFLWYQCVPLTLLCLRNYRDFRIRPFFTLYSLFKSGGCREYLLLGWCTTLVASFGKHIYLFLFVCPILIHIEKMCINMVSLEKFLLILCGVYLLIHWDKSGLMNYSRGQILWYQLHHGGSITETKDPCQFHFKIMLAK